MKNDTLASLHYSVSDQLVLGRTICDVVERMRTNQLLMAAPAHNACAVNACWHVLKARICATGQRQDDVSTAWQLQFEQ